MFSLVPVRLRKILHYWEIYNLARNIQLELTIHFTPYNKVHTNLALFFTCGYENLSIFDMQISGVTTAEGV